MQPINMIMIYYWDKKLHVSWCEFMLNLDSVWVVEDSSLWFFVTKHMKDQVLENVFGGTFLGSSRQNLSLHPHCHDILQSTSCRSGFFCLHVSIVYWSCGLKFVYPTINLAFLVMIIKVKLPAKFCLHSFEWFCL